MKKTILNIIIAAFALGSLYSCSDWTEVERNDYFVPKNSPEYYAALREYKKTDHPKTFGWFGNWTGIGANMQNSLMGLPDSVDFVSMWGNWHSLNDAKKEDLRRAQEIKGLKVLMCFRIQNIGTQTTPPEIYETKKCVDRLHPELGVQEWDTEEKAVHAFWGWVSMNYNKDCTGHVYEPAEADSLRHNAVRLYAHSILDTIEKYNWDGFDYDYEVSYGDAGDIGGPSGSQNTSWADPDFNRRTRGNFKVFIEELAKYLGPQSGTDKLLVIDGEPQTMHPDCRDLFNYYIIQAYYSTGDHDLDSRLRGLLRGLEADSDPELAKEVVSKLIWAEDFEKAGYAPNGGNKGYASRKGGSVPSFIGMALWESKEGYKKGGVGTYHMEYEYPNKPEYKWLRMGTGIMNPSLE